MLALSMIDKATNGSFFDPGRFHHIVKFSSEAAFYAGAVFCPDHGGAGSDSHQYGIANSGGGT